MLFTTLKYKKLGDIKVKRAFQAIAIELYKHPKETKRKRKRTPKISRVISSIRVGVVAKTDDEAYVSSTITIYSYFLFVFSTMSKRASC